MPTVSSPDPQTLLPLTAAVFAILLSLSHGDRHGYAIMKDAALAHGGSVSMGPGTLYGSIDRMMRSRLVEETGLTDDARRRYYRLTRFGHSVLAAELDRLSHVLAAARPATQLPGSRTTKGAKV